MSQFDSLLLPLDGSPEAAKGVGCALWLAEELAATLHVLHASTQPLAGQEALARLHIPGEYGQVVLHQLPDNADVAVLQAIETHGVDLVVMSARGESASAGRKLAQYLGSVAQAVIERSPAPVLLLPVRYHEILPWTSMLAAASGGAAADEALEAATRLAAALRLKVTVVHATDGPDAGGSTPLGMYADAVHHEYPHRIEEMVERGLTRSTHDECCCIDQVLLRRGDPATVLLDQVTRYGCSVLALGWHGRLGTGRALVLKRLLERAECALLLVRKPQERRTRLKVGDEMY